MRLINAATLKFEEFFDNQTHIPPYVILSHTWENEEVTFLDMTRGDPFTIAKRGYSKITETCRLAIRKGIGHVWVDTCCIDISSSAELTEAINSMFRWYQRAKVCLVYLADLEPSVDFEAGIDRCRWITRGWTLQELIAPYDVEFYDQQWRFRGSKLGCCKQLSKSTRIPKRVLLKEGSLSDFSIAQRLSWASQRNTTRVEDETYCLLGLLEVNMPLIYGEGKMAFRRLQEEVIKRSNDLTIFAWNPIPGSDNWHGHCSVLASSPLAFKESGNIGIWHISKHNPEFTLTNKGIQVCDYFVYTPLENSDSKNSGQRAGYVWLIGKEVSDTEIHIGIHLRKVGESLFLRESRQLRRLGRQIFVVGPPTETATCYLVTNVRPFNNATIAAFRRGCTEVVLPGWRVVRATPLGFWDGRDLIQFSVPPHYVQAILLEGTVGGQIMRFTVLIKQNGDMRTPLIGVASTTPATNYIFRRRPSGDILQWVDLNLDHPEVNWQLSNEVKIMVEGRNFIVRAGLLPRHTEVSGHSDVTIYSLQLEVVELEAVRTRRDSGPGHWITFTMCHLSRYIPGPQK